MARTQIVLLALFSPNFKLLRLLLLLQCTKMSTPSKLHFRELIINFVLKKPSIAKREVVRRFSANGVASSTVYNVLNNFKARGHSQNMPKGRKASKMTTTKRRELIRRCKGKEGVSQRKLSKKYGISQSYVNKVLKEGK